MADDPEDPGAGKTGRGVAKAVGNVEETVYEELEVVKGKEDETLKGLFGPGFKLGDELPEGYQISKRKGCMVIFRVKGALEPAEAAKKLQESRAVDPASEDVEEVMEMGVSRTVGSDVGRIEATALQTQKEPFVFLAPGQGTFSFGSSSTAGVGSGRSGPSMTSDTEVGVSGTDDKVTVRKHSKRKRLSPSIKITDEPIEGDLSEVLDVRIGMLETWIDGERRSKRLVVESGRQLSSIIRHLRKLQVDLAKEESMRKVWRDTVQEMRVVIQEEIKELMDVSEALGREAVKESYASRARLG